MDSSVKLRGGIHGWLDYVVITCKQQSIVHACFFLASILHGVHVFLPEIKRNASSFITLRFRNDKLCGLCTVM